MSEIQFSNNEINFRLKNKTGLRVWLHDVAEEEGYHIEELCYIFCSDDFLLKLNIKHLQHDTLTDVITFDNSIVAKWIIGDIFISTERIAANANTYKVSVTEELHRVMVHGLLHLCGYKDKTSVSKKKMTAREDYYLNKRQF